MSIGKLRKFAELDTFPNVFQSPDAKKPQLHKADGGVVELAGRWNEYFKNSNPIVAELGCGRGEYTLALAETSSAVNYVGVDIKGARIWKGAKRALESGLTNVAFTRIHVDHLPVVFGPEELSDIWLTFPDPYPKKAKWKKRLTSSKFLRLYRDVLRHGGAIHLKTDSELLFQFTLETVKEEKHEVLERVDDVWAMERVPPVLQIATYYEKMHLAEGRTIKYLKFKLN